MRNGEAFVTLRFAHHEIAMVKQQLHHGQTCFADGGDTACEREFHTHDSASSVASWNFHRICAEQRLLQ
jgi:hypothetical protein